MSVGSPARPIPIARWIGRAILAAAVAWPVVALAIEWRPSAPEREVDPLVMMSRPVALFATTFLYAAGGALLAAALGWLPGRWIAAAPTAARRAWRSALVIGPACLPPAALFYAWRQVWPADSAVFAWAQGTGRVPLVHGLTALVAFASWGWPVVAWCVAGAAGRLNRDMLEAAMLDGASAMRRQWSRCRAELPGAALGMFIVAIVIAGHTTAFDLANIVAVANELRALDAAGAPRAQLLRLGAVPIAVAAVGALGMLIAMRRASMSGATRVGVPGCGIGARLALGLALALVVAPLVTLAVRLAARSDLGLYFEIYGSSLSRSVGMAALTGGAAVLLALGAMEASIDRRVGPRRLGEWMWLAAALAPATLIAMALEAAYNRAALTWVYGSWMVVVLGHLARFGFLPVLLGARVIQSEGPDQADLRVLDGVRSLRALVACRAPQVLAALLASFVVAGALGLGEMAVTARVHPPASDPLVVRLLNDMHYQRPQMVIVTLGVFVAGGLAAAVALGLAARVRVPARPSVLRALLLVGLLAAAGCRDAPSGRSEAEVTAGFGGTGTALGRFTYPRSLVVDEARGALYAVDKTARIQRYDLDGRAILQWRMPEWELGKPTGISVAPDGRVVVADTHYHRIVTFDDAGNELRRFGAYGEEPGSFIYPTDVAFGADGRWYVSEYGGNDRIQVFDGEGGFLFEFGSPGPGAGQFERPQAIAFSHDGTELYIADSCNHRIVVTDPEGAVIRMFGSAGRAPGRMLYPYGLHVRPDGTLVVCEFGNHRIQHFTAEGVSLGQYGEIGTGPGQLRYPWSVDGTSRTLYVLDSGNDRIRMMTRPWPWSSQGPGS